MVVSPSRALSMAFILSGVATSTACVGIQGDDASEEAEQTGEVASAATVDIGDTHCAAAFTNADRLAIQTAISASNLAPAERVSHALNRFGYGDRFAATALPTDSAATLSAAVIASLRDGSSITASVRGAMDRALPTLARNPGDVHYEYRRLFLDRDAALAAGDATTAAALATATTALRDRILDELAQKQIIAAALTPDIGLGEHFNNFWLNHFNVDGRDTAIWATAYENTIRSNICGSFAGMLKAVAHTPAMLRYLENHISTAPGTVHWSGSTDINENYARELLELHTLGGGAKTTTNPRAAYSQSDIIQVARMLTGWSYTYASDQRSTLFQFQSAYHMKGTKTVMGTAYPDGEAGGNALLTDLANHDQTKRFICNKLVGEFFATVPTVVADACVAAWGSGGNLPRMYTAILSHPQTWKAAQYGNKIKNPFELVVSSHRLSGDTEVVLTGPRARSAMLAMRKMGLPLWRIDPPTGYSSNHLDWLDPGYLNEQAQYVYGQSDPLGLTYGTATGLAVESQLVAMAKTPAQKVALTRTSILPTRSLSFPTDFDDTFLTKAFSLPDRVPASTTPARPVRSLLSYYATSWNFLVK